MRLMTRVKVIGVVITLAVAAGVLAFRDEWGRPDPSSDVNELVTVHAQWYPNRGARPIHVIVTAEGVPLHEDELVTSPWDRGWTVPKGTPVTATFTQTGRSGDRLTCRIDRPGRVGQPKSIETPGTLICAG